MKINISSKDIEIDVKRAKIINDKLVTPLSKYLKKMSDDVYEGDMVIKKGSRWGYRITMNMLLPKNFKVYATTKQKEFVKAVTDLREELERQIKEYKSRLISKD